MDSMQNRGRQSDRLMTPAFFYRATRVRGAPSPLQGGRPGCAFAGLHALSVAAAGLSLGKDVKINWKQIQPRDHALN